MSEERSSDQLESVNARINRLIARKKAARKMIEEMIPERDRILSNIDTINREIDDYNMEILAIMSQNGIRIAAVGDVLVILESRNGNLTVTEGLKFLKIDLVVSPEQQGG